MKARNRIDTALTGNSNARLHRVCRPVVLVDSNHGGTDGMASSHSKSSDEQGRLAADLVERDQSRADSYELPAVRREDKQSVEGLLKLTQ